MVPNFRYLCLQSLCTLVAGILCHRAGSCLAHEAAAVIRGLGTGSLPQVTKFVWKFQRMNGALYVPIHCSRKSFADVHVGVKTSNHGVAFLLLAISLSNLGSHAAPDRVKSARGSCKSQDHAQELEIQTLHLPATCPKYPLFGTIYP